jgi:hypothetical protein
MEINKPITVPVETVGQRTGNFGRAGSSIFSAIAHRLRPIIDGWQIRPNAKSIPCRSRFPRVRRGEHGSGYAMITGEPQVLWST